MEIIAYIYVGFLIFTGVFLILAVFVENNVEEEVPFKKWWRKHIVGKAPQDMDI